MAISRLCLYEPAWSDPAGARRFGWDEDEMTAGVEVCSGLAVAWGDEPPVLGAVRRPGAEALQLASLPRFLGWGDACALEERLGGAATVLEWLAEPSARRVLVATEHTPAALSAAAVIEDDERSGPRVRVTGRSSRAALPAVGDGFVPRTRPLDARLVRESVLTPVLEDLLRDVTGPVAIVGPEAPLVAAVVRRLPHASGLDLVTCVEGGAARVLHVLADLAAEGGDDVTVIGFDPGGRAVKTRVTPGEVAVTRLRQPATDEVSLIREPDPDAEGSVPLNSAGFVRDHLDKGLLRAAACTRCGTEFFPPRRFCSACRADDMREFALSRSGEVVSAVTRYVPIPGLPDPMGVAVVKVDGSSVRVMTHVTDGDPARVAIGDRGSLRFRRIATRAGVPDYAFGFRPEAATPTEDP